MPELPEVEHLRLSLLPRLLGRTFTVARVHRRDVVVAPGDPPGGFARAKSTARPRRLDAVSLLVGAPIAELRRTGKQLAIIADDGRTACIHLGMSGQLRWHAPDGNRRNATHEHLTWRLDDDSTLVFRDPRRFGGIWVFPSIAALQTSRWSTLGPDALSITPDALSAGLLNSERPLKAALLDQSVIAGVGNIYADEALFMSRISPVRAASALHRKEVESLVASIRKIMLASINAGGSSLRDYLDGDGNRGENQRGFAVYGRGGEPCIRCSTPLASMRVAQRATVMCRTCQR